MTLTFYDDGEELQITLHGNDFLHNMARMILGTLLDIGVGNRKKEDIELIFEFKLRRGSKCTC